MNPERLGGGAIVSPSCSSFKFQRFSLMYSVVGFIGIGFLGLKLDSIELEVLSLDKVEGIFFE